MSVQVLELARRARAFLNPQRLHLQHRDLAAVTVTEKPLLDAHYLLQTAAARYLPRTSGARTNPHPASRRHGAWPGILCAGVCSS
jgi:hypothetical protein